MDESDNNSLFLVVPVPHVVINGEIRLEPQSLHGMNMYAENFSSVTVALPELPTYLQNSGHSNWLPISELKYPDRVTILPLPWGYSPVQHFKHYRYVADLLSKNIETHQYLQFAIGGYFGDWGALACILSKKVDRPYSVWADRVEPEIIRKTDNDSLKKKIRNFYLLKLMEMQEQKVVTNASVGLFNGSETFNFYKRFNKNSHQLHDIHTTIDQQISQPELELKTENLNARKPLKVVYFGRASAMKAPLQWIEVLKALSDNNVEFTATWYGDGEELEALKQKINEYNLDDCITAPGFCSDHGFLMQELKKADIFLFTHVTPESPRCLIEALVCGAPIIGYESDYTKNLINKYGGGSLVKIGEIQKLANTIFELNKDREELATLTKQAAENGKRFNDIAAFKERSDLIKEFSAR